MTHNRIYPGMHSSRTGEYAVGDLVYVSTARKQATVETYNHDAEKYWPDVTVRYDDGIIAAVHSWQLSRVVK